jgi:DNA-binding NarL/FixJ family response regulator
MNLLLVDDHPIFRFGVRHLVSQHWPDVVIVETGSLAQARAALHERTFQIALVDLNLPDSEGIEIVAQLQRIAPALRILVLSFNTEATYARRSLQMGAAGYLAKDRAAEELVAALDRIAAGGRYITASLAEELAEDLRRDRLRAPHETLSTQEYRVMIRLAEGERVSDIAAAMHLSPKTVSTYRTRILDKLAVDSNAELARYCITHRIVGVPRQDV